MWIVLGVIAYLLIGGIIYAVLDDESDELSGVIFAWPIAVVMFAIIFGAEACKAFGRFVVNTIKHYIYEGEQNEKENN